MNFLDKNMKKGLFKEAEKAWDQNKSKLGFKTGGASGAAPPPPPPAQQPPPPPPPEEEDEEAQAQAGQVPPPPPGAPGVGAAPTGAAGGASAQQPAAKPSLQEKLMSKVNDPAVQAKAEKFIKDKATRKLFGRRI